MSDMVFPSIIDQMDKMDQGVGHIAILTWDDESKGKMRMRVEGINIENKDKILSDLVEMQCLNIDSPYILNPESAENLGFKIN